MTPLLTTPRCALRKFVQGDLARYHLLTGSARVMEHVTGRAFSVEETAEKFERVLARNTGPGPYGIFAVEDRESGEFLGAAALTYEPSGRLELGYRIVEGHWGRGLATEVASALLRFAHETLQAQEVCAYVSADNAASLRVLEKLGMRCVGGEPAEREYLWTATARR